MLIRIEGDVFDVARRIKEIDGRYELYYNRRLRAFEVHIEGYGVQAVLPYPTLDARSVKYMYETRRENAEKLIAKIERDNAAAERKKYGEILERAAAAAEEAMR